MVIQTMMYSAYFEARICLHGKMIGRTMKLSDPDVFPAVSDNDAVKKAFEKAEMVEYLKSLRIRGTESDKKILVRLRSVVRKDKADATILTPKYNEQKGFKKLA